jgi:hypothetical protein
MTGRAAAGR